MIVQIFSGKYILLRFNISLQKQRSRKKIKVLSSKLSEFKQEANFQMMELREEIARLKEDNLTLQGM